MALKTELDVLAAQLNEVGSDGIASPREKKIVIKPNYEILKKMLRRK
ncbi:hypothetical protein KRR40_12710 [Niabella defluvii]|nr:hypothetical protein KRR40_12710 [Niabella sp. I65]